MPTRYTRNFLMGTVCPVLGLTAGLLLSSNAFAQQKIEQMIVTAQKRAQDVQAVPAAISAFSGASLEQRQIKNLEDLSKATPNVYIGATASGTVPQLSIRGVSMDGVAFNIDQSVALHIDGVYQPTAMGLKTTMLDLESVEVLRGPQGTLYGRNANAGVINLITKKPTDTFEASGTIFGGNFDSYGARGYVSGPITEGVSARISGLVDRSAGYGDNLYLHTTVNGHWTYGARAAVRLQPTEDVTVDLSVSHEYAHNNNPNYVSNPQGQSGPNYVAVQNYATNVLKDPSRAQYTLAPWKVYANTDGENASQITSATGTITWDATPDLTFKSISGWQRAQSRGYKDYDATSVPYIYIEALFHSNTFSQEFNANANLWDNRINLVSGLYYLNDKKFGGGSDVFFPAQVTATPAGFLSSGNPLQQFSETKAVFLDLTGNVTDDLRVIGGIRRTWTEKDTIQRVWGAVLPFPPVPSSVVGILTPTQIAGLACNDVRQAQNFTSTTYRGGVQYDFTPDIMGYVTYATGFKDGGFNASLCNDDFASEQIYSWEAGIKTTLFNGTTTLNADVFHYKYSNMQTTRVVTSPTGASFSTMDNVPATIKGAEIELDTYLTDDLKLNVGVGLLQPYFGTFLTFNSVPTGTNVPYNATGNQIPRAPKVNINAGLEYTWHLAELGDLKSRAEYSYISRVFYDSFQQSYAEQDGYSLWNAIFTFTPANCENLEFKAYVKNITDKAYLYAAFGSGTLRSAKTNWASPRIFGGEITAKF